MKPVNTLNYQTEKSLRKHDDEKSKQESECVVCRKMFIADNKIIEVKIKGIMKPCLEGNATCSLKCKDVYEETLNNMDDACVNCNKSIH